jgi:hypothetical protein
LREAWVKQNDAINLVLANENRLTAINRLAVEAAIRGHAMTEAAEAAGGRLPLLTERILRGAHQLAWAPGFDEATARNWPRIFLRRRNLRPPTRRWASASRR